MPTAPSRQLAPIAPVPSGTIAVARVGDQGREEGDRLLEVDEELGRRDDVEALEVRRLAVEEPLAPRGWATSSQRLSLSRFGRSRSQEWRTSRAVSRRPSWKRTPGRSRNRKRVPSFSVRTSEASQGTIRVALGRPGQRLEDARQDLGLLDRVRQSDGIEAPHDARDRHVEDAAAARPLGGRRRRPAPPPFRARRS